MSLPLAIATALLLAASAAAEEELSEVYSAEDAALEGAWRTDEGPVVCVDAASGFVMARFQEPSACPYGGGRELYVEGAVDYASGSLTGQIHKCEVNLPEQLVHDCGLPTIRTRRLRAKVSRERIEGTWDGEEVRYETDDGGRYTCTGFVPQPDARRFSLRRITREDVEARYEELQRRYEQALAGYGIALSQVEDEGYWMFPEAPPPSPAQLEQVLRWLADLIDMYNASRADAYTDLVGRIGEDPRASDPAWYLKTVVDALLRDDAFWGLPEALDYGLDEGVFPDLPPEIGPFVRDLHHLLEEQAGVDDSFDEFTDLAEAYESLYEDDAAVLACEGGREAEGDVDLPSDGGRGASPTGPGDRGAPGPPAMGGAGGAGGVGGQHGRGGGGRADHDDRTPAGEPTEATPHEPLEGAGPTYPMIRGPLPRAEIRRLGALRQLAEAHQQRVLLARTTFRQRLVPASLIGRPELAVKLPPPVRAELARETERASRAFLQQEAWARSSRRRLVAEMSPPPPGLRAEAFQAHARAILEEAGDDPDPEVRRASAHALERLSGPRPGPLQP